MISENMEYNFMLLILDFRSINLLLLCDEHCEHSAKLIFLIIIIIIIQGWSKSTDLRKSILTFSSAISEDFNVLDVI